jgi:NAD(P)-dependent dehydrogenase (short-subunit alcohol dehydrogenase family)
MHTLNPLHSQNIVINGATGHLGSLLARLAGGLGAKLVLLDQDGYALERLSKRLGGQGYQTVFRVTDSSSIEDLKAAAEYAVSTYQHIDSWINNAMAMLSEDALTGEQNSFFGEGFWQVVHGCRIATSVIGLRGGAILNIAPTAFTLENKAAEPISHRSLEGYCDTLRRELAQAGLPISVTLIKPCSTGLGEIAGVLPQLDGGTLPRAIAEAVLCGCEIRTHDVLIEESSLPDQRGERSFVRVTESHLRFGSGGLT